MKKLIFVALLSLSGLILGCPSPSKVVKCQTQLKYSGYNVTISGLEVPFSDGKTFRLGKMEMKPEKIQEAKDLTQALDLLQFSDCQTMVMLHSDEAVLTVRKHRDATLKVLGDIIQTLNNSESSEQHAKAIDAGKQQLQVLENTKP